MAPSIRMEKFAVNNYTSTPGPFPAPTPADSSGTITNVVFGLLALVIGVTTVWQAHRAYYLWNRQEIQRASNEAAGMQFPNLNHEEIRSPFISNAGSNNNATPQPEKGFEISIKKIQCCEQYSTAQTARGCASVAKAEEV